jgi:alkanesulfonate monooxygenase SsuD/methylene tetrahydromethanopterin reductase-like flavin-dependent oxidoreductase (luciferase family)
MQLGCFTMPRCSPEKYWRQSLRSDQGAFMLADDLGFAEGYFGEASLDRGQGTTSCLLFIASLAARVKRMRLGTAAVTLPRAHPAHLAAQVALLNHLLDGRLNLGILPGEPLSDGAMFGMFDPDGIAPFLDGVEQVLALLSAGTPHDARGRHRDFKDRDHWTSRTHRPVTGPGTADKGMRRAPPPVLVTAVVPFCRGVTAAAARGWDPISAHFLLPRWVATHRDSYLNGCAQGGRPAHLANWRVARSIFVADDLATARDYARGPGSPYVAYYRQLLTRLGRNGFARLFKEDPSIPDEAVTLDDVLDRVVIWGTPDKVADELEAFREAVGPFGTLLYAGHDWADAHLARRSMVLLAEQVQPRIARIAEVAE